MAAEDEAEAWDWDLFVATLQADAVRRRAADVKAEAHHVDTEAKACNMAEAKAHCVAAKDEDEACDWVVFVEVQWLLAKEHQRLAENRWEDEAKTRHENETED